MIKYPKAVIKQPQPTYEDTFEVDMSKVVDIINFNDYPNSICSRGTGEFKYKAIYLNDGYDWKIVRDGENCLVLLKLKKDNA